MFKGLSHSGAEVSHLKMKDGVNAVDPSEALKRGRTLTHGTIMMMIIIIKIWFRTFGWDACN